MDLKDLANKFKSNLVVSLKENNDIKTKESSSRIESTNKQLVTFKSPNYYYIINEELRSKLISSLIKNNQILFTNSNNQIKTRMDLFRENNQLLTSLDGLRIANKVSLRPVQSTPLSSKKKKQVNFNITKKSNSEQNSKNLDDSKKTKMDEACIKNEETNTDLFEEYREMYRSFVGGKKIDLNKHNIFLWLTAFEIYTSKKDDIYRLDNLSKYFDTSLQKMIDLFRKERSDYRFVKDKLLIFICVYLDQSLNPICEKQFNKIANLFEQFDFTKNEKKYLLNCYCNCVKLLDDPKSQTKFSFATLFLLEKYKMNSN